MADVFFENPPVLSGKPEQQLVTLYNHLFTLSNKLNEALMNISIEQMAPEDRQVIRKAEAQQQESADEFTRTKALIIKTAEIVRTEMEEIRAHLQTDVDAISDQFGEYQATLESTISATAEGILQDYHIEERISGVEGQTDDFIRSTSQYIFSGLLDANTQTYGIAIGYNVTDPDDGTLVDANKMATFTADRMSFYLNGTEVSYYSGNTFHIANGEVTDSMRMGAYLWKVFANGSMGLMKE